LKSIYESPYLFVKISTMKKLIYALLLLSFLMIGSLSAQTGVRFGLKSGYSMATQYGITPDDLPYTVDTDYRHGFAGGIMLYFPITESFGIQQELLYTTKGSRQHIKMDNLPVTTFSKYNLDYFELPILFRYTFVKIGNVGIYGSTGFALSILLNGDYSTKSVIDLGYTQITETESGDLGELDTFDFAFLYGAGLDFDLFNMKWFIEYRFTIGWNTLMMPTFEGEAPAPLRNQDYIFTLGIYF
jgi:hypothetical protein